MAETTTPLANPFRPGNGVPPPYLAGRDALLAEFEAFTRERPLHPNWTLTGLRGTGKTVLLADFAARAERAGWIVLQREVGERHRDDARLADALEEDADALRRRISPLAAVGQAVGEGARRLRPRRLTIGELGYEPADETGSAESADRMRARQSELDAMLRDAHRPGALLLLDEAHLLAEDQARERFPLSSLLAAAGHVQRSDPRVRSSCAGCPPSASTSSAPARTPSGCSATSWSATSTAVTPGTRWACRSPRPAARSARRSSHTSSRRPGATRTSSSSSAPTCAGASRPRASRTATTAPSSRHCSTSWTSRSSRTASRARARPSSGSSRRWRAAAAKSASPTSAGSCPARRASTSSFAGPSSAASSTARAAAPTTSRCTCSATTSAAEALCGPRGVGFSLEG
ncbi:MAG: ATP-binding protein [Candidatus Limnocylindrales bacterium]